MAWVRAEITVGGARAAAIAAHSAAREADLAAARAAATAHMAAHALHIADYAARAVAYAKAPDASDAAGERERQYRRLPEHLRKVAYPGR